MRRDGGSGDERAKNFHPINVEEDAYTSNLVKDGGAAVEGMYISVGFSLYLGADDSLPAVRLFTKWMNKADPSANFELEALFGWASAELFVDGLRKTLDLHSARAGLEAALDKVTSFNANGLLATGDPAHEHPRLVRASGPGQERSHRPNSTDAQDRIHMRAQLPAAGTWVQARGQAHSGVVT